MKPPANPSSTRPKTTTIPDWHFKPPDQQILDAPPRVPKFPTFTKKHDVTIQPPPGLQQQPEVTTPATTYLTDTGANYRSCNNNRSDNATTTSSLTQTYNQNNACEE
eukprot:6491629-Amphidinium_carterae.1